jgi:hypothetical protein
MTPAAPLPCDPDSPARHDASGSSGQQQGPVPTAICASRAKLTALGLRRLKEHLFMLQSSVIEDMIRGGINISKVTVVSHVAKAIEAVDVLEVGTRER